MARTGFLVLALALAGGAPATAAEPTVSALPAQQHDASSAPCLLGAWQSDHTVRMPNCPDDVKQLVDRAINCQHWIGEEPYDNARAHEIETAIAELKCHQMPNDHDALLRKYADERDVIEAMQDADREYSLEF